MTKVLFILLCSTLLYFGITYTLVACNSESPSIVESVDITTIADHYQSSITQQKTERPKDGFVGLIKIFAEHGVEDIQGTRGTYVIQGTGAVFVKDIRWFIVTAKHMVMPSNKLQSINLDRDDPDKKVVFTTIRKTGASILIGRLSVEPLSIWLPNEEEMDVAVLEISEDLSASIVNTAVTLSTVGSEQILNPTGLEGQVVKIWGYPARQSAQVDSANISDTHTEYFVLNKEVEQGYSGGLVLLEKGNTEMITGMVIRTDKENNQSTVLSWSLANSLLDAAASNSSSVRKVVVNEIVEYPKDISFQFAAFNTLPFTTTVQAEWWQFWK